MTTGTVLLQQTVNALTVSAIYAMIAVGLTLIYGVLRILHVAHAGVYAAGAYLGLLLFTSLQSLVLALVGAMALAGALGVIVERVVYRPMLRQPRIIALIASIGLYICFADLFRLLAGPHERAFDVGVTARYQMGSFTISAIDAMILGGTAAIFILVWLLLHRTWTGFAIRAVAQDAELASTMGIEVHRAVRLVFLVGSAIAAFGGVMIGVLYNAVYPAMGDVVSYKGLALIVIGGFGSMLGAVLAAVVLGVGETVVTTYTQMPLSREGIAMLLLIVVILFRPYGLLGRE